MNRIAILGNGGAGKSTLAIQLGELKRIPVFHLDQLIWKDNWTAVSESEFKRIHDSILDKSKWIIEGLGYDSTLFDRLDRADQVVFIDLPLIQHFYWATKRSIKSFWSGPKGWAIGNKLILKLPYIYRIIWHVHKHTRPYILDLVSGYSAEKLVHIRSKKELNQFSDQVRTINKTL
jgi:adenylate kinase family enzyme